MHRGHGEEGNGMGEMRELLGMAAERGARYVEGVGERRVAPGPEALAGLARFREKLPEGPTEARRVIEMLDDVGSPATVAATGGRYFGFVIGGTLPAAMAANWLASAWDQNVALRVMSPVAAELADVVRGWICDGLGLPAECDAGVVTCATGASC